MRQMNKRIIAGFMALLIYHMVLLGTSEEVSPKREFDYEYRLPDTIMPIVYDLKLTFASKSDEIIGQKQVDDKPQPRPSPAAVAALQAKRARSRFIKLKQKYTLQQANLFRVRIELQCKNATSVIELSASPLFLTIQHATLEHRLMNATLNLGLPLNNWDRFTVEFHLDAELRMGHVYYLSLWFTTKYSDDHLGLSRHYNEEYGTWLNSLFEPYLARRLLPCFDEPRWRSVFKLQLWLQGEFANKSYVALSNTEGRSEQWNEYLSIWTFDPTPPIPTYLFTISVGKFRSVCEIRTAIDREVCIWRFSYWKEWENVANVVIEAMRAMTDYLLADPIARLHLLILPLKINGMENFGLLNVKEAIWPIEDDQKSYEVFYQTLFHEMAHQCYDSSRDLSIDPLVSPKWASHVPTMVYNKGAAVIEMLDSVIGEVRMRRLLRSYIRMNEFGSSDTKQFLFLLQKITQADIPMSTNFLSAWLHQGSHPIVFVDYDSNLNQFCLSQVTKMGTNNVRWPVPIWIDCVHGTVPETLYWITPEAQLIVDLDEVTSTNLTQSVAFNRNRAVYYQISYRFI